MRCVVVLLFILLAPFARAERSSLRVPGAPSPVVGINSFDSMGVASYGPGIPSPTIDCVADGAAGYACTGATATAGGTGTMSGTSPFWYTGDLVTKPSTVYNGSGWHGLGDVGAHTGSFSGCTTFYTSAVDATSYYLHGRASNWVLIRYAATLYFYVYRAGGSETADTIGGLVANAWNVACWSYDLPTRKIRLNMNGVAATDGTGSSDITDGGTALKLGGGAVNWRGGVERFSDFNGFAASAAQLATMTKSQRSLIATKPATSEATHTRVDATLCCPFTDAECHWLAPNVPCIHAPTYSGSLGGAGIEVYGPGQNLLLYSNTFENAAWGKNGALTVADASASCPVGPLGTNMALVSGGSGAIYQDRTAGTTLSVWLAYPTGGSACNVDIADAINGGRTSKVMAAVPVRHSLSNTGYSGIAVEYSASGGCASWCMQGAQSTPTAAPVPYRATTGTAYLAASGTVLYAPLEPAITNAKGCAGARFTYRSSQDALSRVLGFTSAPTPLFLQTSTALGFYDGTTATLLTVPSMVGRTIQAASCWGGTSATLYDLTDSLSGPVTYDGAFLHADRRLHIGSDSGTGNFLNSTVSRVIQCRSGGPRCK